MANIIPPPVRIDLVISQGSTLDKTVWFSRDGSGNVIDLSTYTANTILSINYLTAINNTAMKIVIATTTDANGGITLSANASTTAAYNANTYVYNTIVYDANSNPYEMLYGVVEIRPGLRTI